MNRAKAKQICIEQARKIARITICKVEGVAGDFEMFEFAIVSTPVVARTRKLRAVWTEEANQRIELLQGPLG